MRFSKPAIRVLTKVNGPAESVDGGLGNETINGLSRFENV